MMNMQVEVVLMNTKVNVVLMDMKVNVSLMNIAGEGGDVEYAEEGCVESWSHAKAQRGCNDNIKSMEGPEGRG